MAHRRHLRPLPQGGEVERVCSRVGSGKRAMEEATERANASPIHTSEGPERPEGVCSRVGSGKRVMEGTPSGRVSRQDTSVWDRGSQKGVREIKCAGIDSVLLQVDESSSVGNSESPENEGKAVFGTCGGVLSRFQRVVGTPGPAYQRRVRC